MMFHAKPVCLLFLLFIAITSAFEGELVSHKTFTEYDGLDLTQGPDLLEIAATAGSRIRIPLNDTFQIAVVQELVDAHIDCEPWYSMFEGGNVTWLRQVHGDSEHEVPFTDDSVDRVSVDERWYNISRTVIVQEAEDSDNGTYTCRVCTAEDCFDAKLLLFLVGSQPYLDKATDNEPEDFGTPNRPVYRIGADFCLKREENVVVTLECLILSESDERPSAYPIPFRTWFKDSTEIYNVIVGDSPTITNDFIIKFPILMPGLVYPDAFEVGSSGSIVLNTQAHNITSPPFTPENVTDANLRDIVFDSFLGTYTCVVENEFGGDEATSIIFECAEPTTQDPTQAPTQATTQVPTDKATESPEPITQAPMQAPTDEATESPEPITQAPMQAPTDEATESPEPITQAPMQAPTDEATECPEVPGNIYFKLNGETYPSGSSVLITDVGAFSSRTGPYFPDSSLVCMTSEVNSKCCTARDGGNVGKWYFPDGSLVPRSKGADFSRNGYFQQVRLSRRNNALSPVGVYTCAVPRQDGCGGQMHTGTISLELPTPSSVMGVCILTVWSPPGPEGSFELFSGYDVQFFIEGGGEITFNKESNQFFHATTDEIRALGQDEDIFVKVRVLADDFAGPWTEPVPLCPQPTTR